MQSELNLNLLQSWCANQESLSSNIYNKQFWLGSPKRWTFWNCLTTGQEDHTNQIRDTADINDLVADEIIQPPRCRHHDLYAFRHRIDLFTPTTPAVDTATTGAEHLW